MRGCELWHLTLLCTIFQIYQSWQSVLLVKETGVPVKILPQDTDKLYHMNMYRVHLVMSEIRTHNW